MARLAQLDWDAGNLDKCQSHGVSPGEIEFVFANDPFSTPDEAHSQDEGRFIAMGDNTSGRLVFIVYTVRLVADQDEIVRPLSARYMHQKEIDRYVRLWRQEGPPLQH
jgi:uncharacterized DUF497 family protein